MVIMITSIAVFVVMLLFPILFSLYSLKKNKAEVLEIEQSKVKDPRYFARSFTKLFDRKWANYDGSGKIFLSMEEDLLEADKLAVYPPHCTSVVYAENLDFRPPEGIYFGKEIYARQNAFLYGIETVRAICSKKDLVLGSGTKVLRWVDAEGTLKVSDNCNLGISASSNTKIVIGNNCVFRRLYAPVVILGEPPNNSRVYDPRQAKYFNPSVLDEFRNIKYVSDDLTDDEGILKSSIITKHDITVLDGLIVKGHIRSHKNIKICDNAVIYGNLFAEKDIYLGQNSRVYGLVFTQGSLYVESGVTLGQPGKIKSVIARGKIIFAKNCCIYGYVSSETRGEYCPDDNISKKDTFFLPNLPPLKNFSRQRVRLALISSGVALTVLIASMLSTLISLKAQERERMQEIQKVAQGQIYGPDGKPGGEQLETQPALITKEYVYFKDRVLERFYYNSQDILQTSQAYNGIIAALPKNAKKYLMLVPSRIQFENTAYKVYSDDMIQAINKIYSGMQSEVITLNAAGALNKHKEEYLFFRSDHVWTALGAYYAAEEFCRNAGIRIKRIEEYQENRLENYLGTMSFLPNSTNLSKYPDYISYYILAGAANEQNITAYRPKEHKYLTYNSPTIAVSRRGYDIFIGSYFSHSVLSGDAKNGKTLLILGDESSKAFAPWLTPYFEKVVLVSQTNFNGGPKEFGQLFSEYGITDFLLMENAQNMGNSLINTEIERLYSGNKG